MNKSVYSLVLMDDVVEQVDRLAYAMHTNRSNMVNQILAEYCSMLTPEKRMQSTLEQLVELLGRGGFQPQLAPGSSMLVVRSALNYKYNPTVRYRLELYREPRPVVGQLQVQLRTQNQELIYYVNEFENLWVSLEEKYLGNTRCTVDNGRFYRDIPFEARYERQPELISQSIENYVNHFDRALKLYFKYLSVPPLAMQAAETEMAACAAAERRE